MLTKTIQTVVISILIIYLVHNLILYFRDTYTTKKTKDVIGFHIQKYKTIMDELQEDTEKERQSWINKIQEVEKIAEDSAKQIDPNVQDLTEIDLRTMNEDLNTFINSQMQ